MKKIVHITKVTGIHGMEKHLLSLLPKLRNRYETECIILTEQGKPVTDYLTALGRQEIVVHEIEINYDIDPACLMQVYRLLKRMQPDLVHTHLMHGDLYGITAARLAGIERVVSTKHNDDRFRCNGVIKRVNRLLNGKTHGTIAISNSVSRFVQTVEGVGHDRIRVIYYGLDDIRSQVDPSEARRMAGFEDDTLVFCIIARLTEQKGHRFLIDAFGEAHLHNPRIRLLVAGDGELRSQLEGMVRERGIQSAVHFTGYRADVPALLGGCDVFVHPSLWEGFGLSILEAMVFAKPIISTWVGAIPELIEHNVSGILVSPRDGARLADALILLAADADLRNRIGEQARNRWQARFTLDRMVRQTEAFYADVFGE